MLNSSYAANGAVVAPHKLAADAGAQILREGGNAIEAMVAAAATAAVVYPHMNSIGGDGFWLISQAGKEPIGINACGQAAQKADVALYKEQNHAEIPPRGGMAALTTAGTIGGWEKALTVSQQMGGILPVGRLLENAIYYARSGFVVTKNQYDTTTAKLDDLKDISGFADHFLVNGRPPHAGRLLAQPALADSLSQLARNGLEDFYRGELAEIIAADLQAAGSPVSLEDLANYSAEIVKPLSVTLKSGKIYNLGAPTQGVASLMILAMFDRLDIKKPNGFDHIHSLVEATKIAFQIRDCVVGDPEHLAAPLESYLDNVSIGSMVTRINRSRALTWEASQDAGDTVWMGAMDNKGTMVSFIQSIYWEYGSGVVLPQSGVTWQNRGASFSLESSAVNGLAPGRKPFHTLNPAMAKLSDGRRMVYGSMGGDGQPQNQAAIFTRYVHFGLGLQECVSLPRWLIGRTWGEINHKLHMEGRISPDVMQALAAVGHDINMVDDFSDMMGHAGALVRHPSGVIEGAFDPRSDGGVSGY